MRKGLMIAAMMLVASAAAPKKHENSIIVRNLHQTRLRIFLSPETYKKRTANSLRISGLSFSVEVTAVRPIPAETCKRLHAVPAS